MKYIVVLGDGMSDEPILKLGGKTPLEVANTPWMDELASKSEIGIVQTIPEGMSTGSDTANLSVLGYDPKKYYSGRSPLEALSIGVNMEETDIALRCNLVTVSEGEVPYENRMMLDHSSGEITTKEAAELMEAVKEVLQNDVYQFHVGTSYRHLTIWKEGSVIPLIPPHDILGKEIQEYLPKDSILRKMMEQSFMVLNYHPINKEREKNGLNKANSVWFWGAGTKPTLDSFEKKFGKKGAMISAVDLLRGIAVGSGMDNIIVEGANGTLHTNWEGKAEACVDALLNKDYDFVYVHLEAPDEMGHQGDLEKKIQAIESLDEKVIGRIYKRMEEANESYRMLILPDHSTPILKRTHTGDPVPYLLYDNTHIYGSNMEIKWKYNEREAKLSPNLIKEGHRLMQKLFI